MANTSSAQKAMRVAERRRIRNRSRRSALKTAITRARRTIAAGVTEEATEATRAAIRQLDVEANRGIIHPNNAARRKSRLMHQLNRMGSAPAEAEKPAVKKRRSPAKATRKAK